MKYSYVLLLSVKRLETKNLQKQGQDKMEGVPDPGGGAHLQKLKIKVKTTGYLR